MSVNKLRDNRIKRNNLNINNLESDLITTRRQVEIIENRNLIKEEIISTLKISILFITLGVIIRVYLKTSEYYKTSIYILISIILLYTGSKLLKYLQRSANRWTLLNWTPTGTPKESKPADDDDLCAVENAEYQASMNKIKNKILDKLISLKSRFKKLDERKALLIDRKSKIKSDYKKIVEQTDSMVSKLPKDQLPDSKRIEFIKAKENKLEDIQQKK
jgi:hypothetical protein